MLGRKPYLERLHPIGTKCFVLDEKRSQDKLAPRSIEGKLVGYSNEGRGYRIFTSDPPKVHASKNVRFPDPSFPKDSDKIEQSKSEDDPAVVTNEEEDDKDENEPTEAYNASRELHNRDNFNKPVDAYSAQADDGPRKLVEPTTYEEAMNSPEKEQWLDSMISEVNSLKMHDTFEVVDLPPNHRAIGLKWVYRAKLKETGEIDKLKSRVVALGYRQRAGIDYDELFSPTARFESLRTILSIASAEKLELLQADVTSAFLNAELKETVYVTQIPGFEDGTNRVLKLRKCLYGLKQSPRAFHLKLRDIMRGKLSLLQSTSDPCIFYRNGSEKIIILTYVDDMILAASSKTIIIDALDLIKEELDITHKPLTYFLGIQVIINPKTGIFIHQQKYILELLEKFYMSEAKPVATPMQGRISPTESEEICPRKYPYRQLIGSLQYLSVCTRPEIAYPISYLSRYLDKYTKSHWTAGLRILRYLKATSNFGIHYGGDQDQEFRAFSDSDYAGDIEKRRSTSGELFKYSGGAIIWTSNRQSLTTLSSCEAELVAACSAAKTKIAFYCSHPTSLLPALSPHPLTAVRLLPARSSRDCLPHARSFTPVGYQRF